MLQDDLKKAVDIKPRDIVSAMTMMDFDVRSEVDSLQSTLVVAQKLESDVSFASNHQVSSGVGGVGVEDWGLRIGGDTP